jgi:hypothetical protein
MWGFLHLDQHYKELIAAFLPDGLLNYFDLTQFSQDEAGLRIHLEERYVVPPEAEGLIYHSKGFYQEVEIKGVCGFLKRNILIIIRSAALS